MKSERLACAACRYHRRTCPPNCILRPYFPAGKQKDFENAQRLFGSRNITKMLQQVDKPKQRDAMAAAIKYEANIRAKFPVHGCCQVMSDLRNQIQLYEAQLHRYQTHLAQIKSLDSSQCATPPPLNPNYYYYSTPDSFSGGNPSLTAQPQLLPTPLTENANPNYHDYVSDFLDSLSGGGGYRGNSAYGKSTHAQPGSNNNYDDATAFLAAQRALPLAVPYPNNDGQIQFDHQTKESGNESVRDDFFSVGGHYGNSAFGEPTVNHGQQLFPNFNNNLSSSLTDHSNNNYDDATDLFSFDFPYPTNDEIIQFVPSKEIRHQSANYMSKDDGNPFC